MDSVRYFLLANLLLAVVSGAFYVLLRRETFFEANRLTLWLGLVGSLVLPMLELPDWRPQPVRAAMQQTAQVITQKTLKIPMPVEPEVTITFPNGRTYPAFGKTLINESWSWQTWLMLGYGAVVLLLLMRFGWQLASLMSLLQKSIHEEYDGFTLVRNESVTSPFSFFRWVVLNPDQHDLDELEQILRHERVHVRARHSLDMITTELVCIVLWFNPAAYLFRRLVHQTLEFSADRAVLQEGVEAKAYQYSLVKVSLMAGRSTLTNSFSTSQIKERIAMLNRESSHQYAWLKYPVVAGVALTVATAFAFPKSQLLIDRVSKPIIKPSVTSAEPTEAVAKQAEEEAAQAPIINKNQSNKSLKSPLSTQPILIDSAVNPAVNQTDSVRKSPSRYITYEKGVLYWVVTPKTTFDDFAVMKQELGRYGHTMQLNEIKYDPLYTYIDRIVFTVQRPTGGMTRMDETEDDDQPIPSIAGYVSIGPNAGSGGTSSVKEYGNLLPEALRKVAADDETAIAAFIKSRRLEYMVQEGYRKYRHIGNSLNTYKREHFQSGRSNKTGITVQSDGSLSINEDLGDVKVFINNESASREAVRTWKVDQLYSVVTRQQYNPAKKEHFTSAVLIYANE